MGNSLPGRILRRRCGRPCWRRVANRTSGRSASRLSDCFVWRKRHLIVGVDTDALTNPYEADMGWAVKLDKPDFVGKALLSRAANDLSRERLIGFVLREPGST